MPAAAATHLDVERTFAAVGGMSLFETDNQCAEFRQTEPTWKLMPQHARIALRRGAAPLAGDDQNQAVAAVARLAQEP